jgi:hypothetical protein
VSFCLLFIRALHVISDDHGTGENLTQMELLVNCASNSPLLVSFLIRVMINSFALHHSCTHPVRLSAVTWQFLSPPDSHCYQTVRTELRVRDPAGTHRRVLAMNAEDFGHA